MMWDSKQLDALAAVAEQGSFEQAAEALGLTPSAVSQRVRALEEEAGFPLLTRTRPCRPTPQGQKILRYIRSAVWLQHEVENELAQADKPFVWPVAVNHDSLDTWFLPVLATLAQQESVLPDIQADNEDHTHKLMTEGLVMAAVSTRAEAMAGCEVHALGSLRYHLLASPEFAARYFANGMDKNSLKQAPVLAFNRKDDMQADFLRQHFGINAARCPTYYMPASTPFFQAACLGLAYGLIPEWQSREALANGRLLDLCPGKTAQLDLYWHAWKVQSARLARLNALVIAEARKWLEKG